MSEHLDLHPAQPGGTVLVGGASGLIGSRLVSALQADGATVRRLVRREPRTPEEVAWSPAEGRLDPAALDDVTAVVVLSGAGVGDHRWTRSYTRELVRSRTSSVSIVAARLAQAGSSARLVTASAVGYYGDRGEDVLTESSGPGEGFLADLCQAWERAADPAREITSVAHARTGIVLAPEGGALGRLRPLIRLGVAGPLGSGRQWWPWITLEDEVRALVHLTRSGVTGPVNLTAPEPVRNRELIRTFAAAMHRPAVLPVPAFALRAALGGFAGDLLASQRVLPEALLADGFEFTSPTIEDAADALVA